MKSKILCFAFPLLPLAEAGAVVVATYRADTPNTFNINFPFHTDTNFDVNGDGVADFRFTSGSFVAAIMGYGSNQFVSALAVPPDQGGYVIPVQAGSVIGADTALLSGDWHHHTDNTSQPHLSSGYSLGLLQHTSAYIAVSFEAEDGIHYGWIHYMGFDSPDNDYFLPGVPGGFINAWAWETEPGKAIVAGAVPEPSAALLFFAGSLMGFGRRNRQYPA